MAESRQTSRPQCSEAHSDPNIEEQQQLLRAIPRAVHIRFGPDLKKPCHCPRAQRGYMRVRAQSMRLRCGN
jgi:hypothetical protein